MLSREDYTPEQLLDIEALIDLGNYHTYRLLERVEAFQKEFGRLPE